MTTPFIDSFDGAGATTDTDLEDWTPTGGTAWTLAGGPGPAQVTTAGALRAKTATASYYTCDDQGSADQYIEFSYYNDPGGGTSGLARAVCRLVDASNWVGWGLAGSGSVGSKLAKAVTGTVTDLISYQGVSSTTTRIECEGTTIRLYSGGSQVGSDQTVSDHQTETSQGVVVAVNANVDWLYDFEAGALGGGATTYTHTASLSSAIQTAQSATAAISAAIQQPNTSTASLSAAIRQVFENTASLNAAILRALAATAAIDVAIQQQHTATASLSGALQQGRSATASLDAYLEAPGLITASLSAAIQQARSATASLSTAIQQARSATTSADAVLAIHRSATASMDGWLQGSITATADLDAAILATRSASASLNAFLVSAGGALAVSAPRRIGSNVQAATRSNVQAATVKRTKR